MRFLLDTDACVHLIQGTGIHPPSLAGGDAGISSITAYELLVGVKKSKSREVKKETLSFLEAVPVFQFDEAAAEKSAMVRSALEKNGCGIGPYDTLIAGHCLALGRTLFTGNVREFKRVPDLPLLEVERRDC